MWKVRKHSFVLAKSNSRPTFVIHLEDKVQLLLKAERCRAWWPPAAKGLTRQEIGVQVKGWVCTSGWSDCIWWGFTPGFLQQSRLLCLAALWHQGNLGTMGYWSWVMRINFGCWSNIARSCWLQAGSQSMHSHKNKLLDTKDSKSLFTASLRVIWPRATAG